MLPIVIGALVTALGLLKRRPRSPMIAACIAAALIPAVAGLHNTKLRPYGADENLEKMSAEIKKAAIYIVNVTPTGYMIELAGVDDGAGRVPPGKSTIRLLTAGLLVELDRFGMPSCHQSRFYEWYLTPRRICSPESTVKSARFLLGESQDCDPHSAGNIVDFPYLHGTGTCFRITPQGLSD